MDEQWTRDPLYRRMLQYIDTSTRQSFHMGMLLASSLGVAYMNPVLPWLVLWGISFRNMYYLAIKRRALTHLPFSFVIRKMELHEDGHHVTVVLSDSIKSRKLDINGIDLCDPQ